LRGLMGKKDFNNPASPFSLAANLLWNWPCECFTLATSGITLSNVSYVNETEIFGMPRTEPSMGWFEISKLKQE